MRPFFDKKLDDVIAAVSKDFGDNALLEQGGPSTFIRTITDIPPASWSTKSGMFSIQIKGHYVELPFTVPGAAHDLALGINCHYFTAGEFDRAKLATYRSTLLAYHMRRGVIKIPVKKPPTPYDEHAESKSKMSKDHQRLFDTMHGVIVRQANKSALYKKALMDTREALLQMRCATDNYYHRINDVVKIIDNIMY